MDRLPSNIRIDNFLGHKKTQWIGTDSNGCEWTIYQPGGPGSSLYCKLRGEQGNWTQIVRRNMAEISAWLRTQG